MRELDELNCENIQLWVKGFLNADLIIKFLDTINFFDFLCVEVCFEYPIVSDRFFYIRMIDTYAPISKIFIFNSPNNYIYEYLSQHKNQHPMLMGQLIYIKHSLDSNNCGIINFENLSFGVETQFQINKKFNGCLYKKLTIDVNGEIRNCPYIKSKIKFKTIKEALLNSDFQRLWFIKKDDIKVCKDCEFRYNCNDCRAFISKDNIYSKPLKCNYNPYTNEWN